MNRKREKLDLSLVGLTKFNSWCIFHDVYYIFKVYDFGQYRVLVSDC